MGVLEDMCWSQKRGISTGVRIGRFMYKMEEEMKLLRYIWVRGVMAEGDTRDKISKFWPKQ